jgi:hypothetical protein
VRTRPYEPTLQIKLSDLYYGLIMGDQKTLDRLRKLVVAEHAEFHKAVTKNPRTVDEWDEWERRRKNAFT